MPTQTKLGEITQPEDACVYFGERCTNLVPHNGRICADCLEHFRARDREEYVP